MLLGITIDAIEGMMGKIGYGYGSEWHLLRYLGYHRAYFSDLILNHIGGQSLSWCDFHFLPPNTSNKHDGEHIGLGFLENAEAEAAWRSFWPQSGNAHNWDAVGEIWVNGQREWLLVEAKAHSGEIKSSCGASSQKSLSMIRAALSQTMASFCETPVPVERWMSPYYQYANRLAMLHFLMKVCDPPIPARLLFIYFTGDRRPDAAQCPQASADWEHEITAMEHYLGIYRDSELYRRVHRVVLPVNPEQ